MVSPLRRVPLANAGVPAQPKVTKGLAPYVRPLAKARGSFAPAFIRGHCPPVGFASTYMQCVRLRRTALRAHPRINTCAQPSEGAGGSRSRAAGELTLGLMSGEKRGCTPLCLCFSVGASLLAIAVDQSTPMPDVMPPSRASSHTGNMQCSDSPV